MKSEYLAQAVLPDRRIAFLARVIVSEPVEQDPVVDAFLCDNYKVHIVKAMSLSVSGSFFNLTVYFDDPENSRKAYLGNDIIRAKSLISRPQKERPLDISEPM